MDVKTSDFEQAADLLAACDQDTCTLGLATISSAQRVGRNDVWKLDSAAGDTRAYLKFATDPRWYARELYGYELASTISQQSQSSMSAEVLFACSTRQCFATSPLYGTPVSEVFKAAYRLDKNPMRSHSKTTLARNAIDAIVRWLRQLHEQRVPTDVELHDHRPSNVVDRVQHLLRTQPIPQNHRNLGDIIGVSADDIPSISNEGSNDKVIFGDVSLGNFFWHNNKIGAIDFEDIGLGNTDRDFVTLRCGILRPLESFYYLTDPSLLTLMPLPERSKRTAVFELENLLHRCVQNCQTRNRAMITGKLSARILRLVSELSNCNVRIKG